jgi:hypothetical protein
MMDNRHKGLPWDVWTDGEEHVLTNDDVGAILAIFRPQFYSYAKRHGKRCRTKFNDDGTMTVQFFWKEQPIKRPEADPELARMELLIVAGPRLSVHRL